MNTFYREKPLFNIEVRTNSIEFRAGLTLYSCQVIESDWERYQIGKELDDYDWQNLMVASETGDVRVLLV